MLDKRHCADALAIEAGRQCSYRGDDRCGTLETIFTRLLTLNGGEHSRRAGRSTVCQMRPRRRFRPQTGEHALMPITAP
jgi:hypothetical protein